MRLHSGRRAATLLVLALSWAIGAIPTQAQAVQPVFAHLSMEDGLSSYSVTALLQDEQGFLWVGTLDGLNRYDGYTFEVFRQSTEDEPGLAHAWVNYGALYEHGGALWIGTRGGLSRYDLATGRFRTFQHEADDAASLLHDNVTALTATDPHTLWVGTARGLGRLDLQSGRFTPYAPDSSVVGGGEVDLVTALAAGADSTLWTGTRTGLYRYDLRRGRFTRPLAALGERAGYVTAIDVRPGGGVWVTSNGEGLLRLAPDGRDVVRYRHDPNDPGSLPTDQVLSLAWDRDGLWVGTWGEGLCHFRASTATFTCHRNQLGDEQSLSDDLVSALMVDRAGNLFAGTWNGLDRLARKKPFRTRSYDPRRAAASLSHRRIGAVYEDDEGMLWIGTLGGGLNRLDRATGAVTHYRHDPDDPTSIGSDEVRSLTEYDGDLWVGTGDAGVSRMDRRTGTFSHYRHDPDDPWSLGSDLVYTTYADPEGTLWVSTVTRSLFRYEPARDGFVAYPAGARDSASLGYNSVWPLRAWGDQLWIGTVGGGLDVLDRRTGTFSHYRHRPGEAASLSSNQVISLALDPDSSLWVGTLGGGLNRLDPVTGRFERYTTNDGLAHHNVSCILPTEQALWVGTTRGLSRLDRATDAFTTFGIQDGLPSLIFNGGACLQRADGELLFGTEEGLLAFYPDEVQSSDYEPPVRITEIELFNRPLAHDSTAAHVRAIALPHDSNFVAFRFAALDYTAPEQNRYAYRLDGVDQDWVEAGSRRYASYANLSPGRYTFRVRGTNSDGVWSGREAAVGLAIRPPFWQRGWFAALALLLGVGLVVGAHRYRVHHLLHTERVRRRIAEDLHDDLGSEIGSLAFSLELAGRSEELDAAQRKRLLGLAQRARRAAASIRETTWVVDARNDSLSDLVDRMHEVTYQQFPDGRARFDAPEELPPVGLAMETRQQVYLLFKEVLYNAQRHAQARRVLVCIRYRAGLLVLRIADDGVGFDPACVQRGNGLGNLHARAERVGGVLTVESRRGQGTTVRFEVRIA